MQHSTTLFTAIVASAVLLGGSSISLAAPGQETVK